jgi:membrane-bound hydrogenase subunit beta
MTDEQTPAAAGTPPAPTLVAERELCDAIGKAFPALADKLTVQRERRVWVDVPMSELHDVIRHAKDTLGFDMLCTITGTDEGADLGLLYHLATPKGMVLTCVVHAPKDGPGPETITSYFPLAELYEREVVDLLGAQIGGLPPGPRYPLPDDWPAGQYPLRKDWKKSEQPAVAKENKG